MKSLNEKWMKDIANRIIQRCINKGQIRNLDMFRQKFQWFRETIVVNMSY